MLRRASSSISAMKVKRSLTEPTTRDRHFVLGPLARPRLGPTARRTARDCHSHGSPTLGLSAFADFDGNGIADIIRLEARRLPPRRFLVPTSLQIGPNNYFPVHVLREVQRVQPLRLVKIIDGRVSVAAVAVDEAARL
jgi:hypothetical protein